MSTQLAIEFLAQSHNDLTSFLTALGLLENEIAITQLKTSFENAFSSFRQEYEELLQNVDVTTSQVKTVEGSLNIANDYYRVENERLQRLLADKTALEKEIEIFEEQKTSIENFSEDEKLVIESKVDEIKQDISDTEEEISQLRRNPNSNEQQIYILQKELNAHLLRYSLQKEILSLAGLDTAQKLESVKLQIEQQTEDLERLNNQEIVEQETLVDTASQKLSTLQSELEDLKVRETSATEALNDFETENTYLLTEDVTGFLDWNIDENTPEVVKLQQQLLAIEAEETLRERLTSLESHASSEQTVEFAFRGKYC